MPKADLSLYADLIPVLDAAIEAGGGSYTLATFNDAVSWRHRVYKFRKAYRTQLGPSKYDALVLRRVAAGTSEVQIDLRRPSGVFTPAQPSFDDPLEAEARALRKQLFGE